VILARIRFLDGVTDGVLVTLGVGDIEIDGVGVGEGHVFTAVHSVQIFPG